MRATVEVVPVALLTTMNSFVAPVKNSRFPVRDQMLLRKKLLFIGYT